MSRNIKYYMEHFISIIGLAKVKLFAAIAGLSLFFSPIAWSLLLVGFFVMFDTLFGRWSAKRIAQRDGKEVRKEVSSKKTRRGFCDKSLMYLLLMSSIYVLDHFMFNQLLMWIIPTFPIEYIISKLMGFILVLIEADSIDEKIYNVKGVRISELIKSKIKGLRGTVKEVRELRNEIIDGEEN